MAWLFSLVGHYSRTAAVSSCGSKRSVVRRDPMVIAHTMTMNVAQPSYGAVAVCGYRRLSQSVPTLGANYCAIILKGY